MFLSADVLSLVLYCVQQLGVTLGVGAQTIMLVAYLSAMRDGVVDGKEAQFARAVRMVLNFGLALIILSGIGITAMHFLGGQSSTIFSEAYLFKWLLVAAVLVFTLLKNLPQHGMQGLAGGSWYALFLLHILAPVASWANLLTLYVVWMIGFAICWSVLIFTTKDKTKKDKSKVKVVPCVPPVPKPVIPPLQPPPPLAPPKATQGTAPPKPVSSPVSSIALAKEGPPPPPKPAPPAPVVKTVLPPANLPVLEQKHILQTLPQPEISVKAQPPLIKEEQNPWLPAVKVMPKETPK